MNRQMALAHIFKRHLVRTGCTFHGSVAPLQKPAIKKKVYTRLGRLALHIFLDFEVSCLQQCAHCVKGEAADAARCLLKNNTTSAYLTSGSHSAAANHFLTCPGRRITTLHKTIILLIFYGHTPLRALEFVTW